MTAAIVDRLRSILNGGDFAALAELLADDVHWYGNAPGGGCRTREEVMAMLTGFLEETDPPRLRSIQAVADRIIMSVDAPGGSAGDAVWLVLTLDPDERIVELQNYSSKAAVEHDLALRAGDRPPPAPVSDLVPFVHVADVERSIRFYRLLGFEPLDTYEPHGLPVWASLRSDHARLMVAHADAPIVAHDQDVLLYLYARDLVALRDHLVAHGLTPGEIVDGSPGPRQEMRVTDPDGYCLIVAQIDDETIVGR